MALATLAAILAVSCSREGRGTSSGRPLQVSGAEVALPFVQELCSSFAATRPEVRFEFLPASSSLGGLQGVIDGALDVGAISRLLTAEEKSMEVKEVWVAMDPLVLVAYPGTGVGSLTGREVRDIYAGKITNWRSLDGADLPIVAISRPEQSSGMIIFRETILGADQAVRPDAVEIAKSDEVHDALLSTPGSFGFTSGSLLAQNKSALEVIRLDGVSPDVWSVSSGLYRAVRPFGFVIARKAGRRLKELSGFALSPAGRAVAERMKLIPMGNR